tara:strand:+ start:94 stop:279 length:186 start_codon:yes stop_codon:yes gene_type:complete
MTRLPGYLQGKNPKTLLEVLEDYEEDEMPVVKGKHYPYTKKGKAAAAAAKKNSGKSGGKRK